MKPKLITAGNDELSTFLIHLSMRDLHVSRRIWQIIMLHVGGIGKVILPAVSLGIIVFMPDMGHNDILNKGHSRIDDVAEIEKVFIEMPEHQHTFGDCL